MQLILEVLQQFDTGPLTNAQSLPYFRYEQQLKMGYIISTPKNRILPETHFNLTERSKHTLDLVNGPSTLFYQSFISLDIIFVFRVTEI